jgi:hypothetical protein
MKRMILGAMLSVMVTWVFAANDWPDTHPCTHEAIPLSSENQVVAAVECIYQGRVAKVEKQNGTNPPWFYRLRVLDSSGRIKEVDIHPQTGLPINKAEREAVYEALNRRG